MGKWIQSYRDLPLLLNLLEQRRAAGSCGPACSCAPPSSSGRRATPPTPPPRTRNDYAEQILRDVYADFMVNVLAIPVLPGRKTAAERFPGAINTLTVEAMMGDGKALQMGTSHDLGQNFAKVFDITYLDANGDTQLCWTTSWGTSTRMVGGLIMAHGDDQGLVVPPALAPIQVVVLLVRDEDGAGDAADALADRAEGRRRAGAPRRPGGHQLRPPGHRLGDQGRPGAHRGRPPRPGRGPGHDRAPRHRREAHGPRRRGRAPGHQPARP